MENECNIQKYQKYVSFPEIFAYALNEFSPLTTLNNTYTFVLSKLAFTCSKSALEPLKKGVKLDQS